MVEDGRTDRNIQVKALVRCGKWGKKVEGKLDSTVNKLLLLSIWWPVKAWLTRRPTSKG